MTDKQRPNLRALFVSLERKIPKASSFGNLAEKEGFEVRSPLSIMCKYVKYIEF